MTAPDLDDWSLGRLLSTAARLIEHDWNDWLAKHDLTHAGLLALQALQGGPLTQRQLAAANRVEEQTMSRVVAASNAPATLPGYAIPPTGAGW
jgi:MarR family transcriptional regulator, organic hydroperoxide resistance regulator